MRRAKRKSWTSVRRFAADGFRRVYGEPPLHLVVLLAGFALCGYALVRLLRGDWLGIAVWFVGAALLHDLVLVPLYTGTDWLAHRALGRRRRTSRKDINWLRVPFFLSLLLLLVYWPLVLRDSPDYERATGLSADVFLGRWLLISAVLFAATGVWLAIRRWRPDTRRMIRGVRRAGSRFRRRPAN
ncbi:hypothetical protein PUR57_02420 [Streptomyces sp. JV176]|uniref:hypothetical protein n=1 Tax=Streptomyces sp. JV176 TaxID=858630 RepID=UPI002E7A3E92|nr:hypothetical protein [Streptomyces sp. JV176]MEE1797549.1 hypothetical protein [Streptomyces sp. JV176]